MLHLRPDEIARRLVAAYDDRAAIEAEVGKVLRPGSGDHIAMVAGWRLGLHAASLTLLDTDIDGARALVAAQRAGASQDLR